MFAEGFVKLSYPQVRVLTALFAARAVRVAEKEERPDVTRPTSCIAIVNGRSGLVASVHSAPSALAAYADIG
jgi:hypothetical protein